MQEMEGTRRTEQRNPRTMQVRAIPMRHDAVRVSDRECGRGRQRKETLCNVWYHGGVDRNSSPDPSSRARRAVYNYCHQPSSPSVGATETVLGVGDGARKYGFEFSPPLDMGVIAAACRQGACIESRTDACGGVATRTSVVVPLYCAFGVTARLRLYTVLARESGRAGVWCVWPF